MKTEKICCLVCFISLLFFCTLIVSCGGGGGNDEKNDSFSPVKPPAPPPVFNTTDLAAAAGKDTVFHASEIDFYVLKADSNDGVNYTVTLRFQTSNQEARGFSAYIFSSEKIKELSYDHPDKWQAFIMNDSPAGNQVRREKNVLFLNSWLVGGCLNKSYSDLGEFTFKTSVQNKHNFVLYTY